MDEPQEPKMTPFDQMISDDSLQMLKAYIPYAPLQMQGFLSVFAEIRELQNVLSLSRRPPTMHMMSQATNSNSFQDMLQDIGRYTNGSLKETFDSLTSAFSMMQMLQSFQGMNQGMNFQNMDFQNMDFQNMDFQNMNFQDIMGNFDMNTDNQQQFDQDEKGDVDNE